jgi:CHAT domain-containing protein
VRQKLDTVQTRIGEIDRHLRKEAPEYFALIQSDPVDLERAQSLLKEDEGLLLAVPSPFGTHVVALTKEGVHWHRSQLAAPLARAAVQVLRWDAGARVSGTQEDLAALREEKKEDGPPSFDRQMAHMLYRELVAPALPLLRGKKRLVVAAGGPLAGLPFSLLVSAPPSGSDADPSDLRNTRWFGDDFALIHIPSIRSLAILRAQPPAASARGGFIGIGNPQLGAATQERRYGSRGGVTAGQIFVPGRSGGGAAADLRQLREMASLPGTGEELRLVRTALGASANSVIEGADATEPAVRNLNFANARLILFSTHGLTSEEASGAGEAGLVLTPPPASAVSGDDYALVDAANDGYLAASEITTLRMTADWVILSACNTATGDDSANLSGLARAFFYAGARSLLASHWPVSDEVAPLLITRTVAPQQAGSDRASALQVAMRSIREDQTRPEWTHPFYWAPFVLIGD